MDLFTYPVQPGFKRHGTSEAAAIHMQSSGKAQSHKSQIMDWFRAGNTGTVDDVMRETGVPLISLRARISQLGAAGMIKRTGTEKQLDSGLMGDVWQAI